MSAFTTFCPYRANRLINTVRVIYGNESSDVLALWDTGASISCIASELSARFGMRSIAHWRIMTPSGMADVPVRRIDLELPNGIPISRLKVCDSAIGQQNLGMLIGMDIISRGDFATSCKNGRTMFTFRTPSQEDANYLV